jgi:hypothetical protein
MELAAAARWRALPSTKSEKREGGDSPATRGGAAVPTGHRSLSLSLPLNSPVEEVVMVARWHALRSARSGGRGGGGSLATRQWRPPSARSGGRQRRGGGGTSSGRQAMAAMVVKALVLVNIRRRRRWWRRPARRAM